MIFVSYIGYLCRRLGENVCRYHISIVKYDYPWYVLFFYKQHIFHDISIVLSKIYQTSWHMSSSQRLAGETKSAFQLELWPSDDVGWISTQESVRAFSAKAIQPARSQHPWNQYRGIKEWQWKIPPFVEDCPVWWLEGTVVHKCYLCKRTGAPITTWST